MVMVVKTEGLIETIDYFNKIQRDLPVAGDKNAWNIAQMVAGELRKGKRMAGIQDWTGNLESSLRAVKVRKNVYGVPMPSYAYLLSGERNRKQSWRTGQMAETVPGGGGGFTIAQWMRSKLGEIKPIIRVRTHPFIDSSIQRAAQRLRGEVEQGPVVRALRKGGRR